MAPLVSTPGAVRWIVQWVPHQFGWRALNLALPLWLARRSGLGDHVELMVHERGLPFVRGRHRQNVAALVQRVMLGIAVRAADHVWMSIPGWERALRAAAGSQLPPRTWLPIPSNIPVERDAEGVERWRARLSPDGGPVVGHFGTFGGPVGERVRALVPLLLKSAPQARFALLGAGGDLVRDRVVTADPALATRIVAPGTLSARHVSLAVQACDLMVQPYPDGVSGRRTSTMVALSHARAVLTNVGALSEPLWQDGAVALAADSPVAYAEAGAALLDDPVRRQSVAAAGRKLYETTFDIARIVAVLQGEAREVTSAMGADLVAR